jgi:hypothetical protein
MFKMGRSMSSRLPYPEFFVALMRWEPTRSVWKSCGPDEVTLPSAPHPGRS